MFNRLGGQRWGEGPIQSKIEDVAQYTKPISIDDLQDAVNDAAKPLFKEDPAFAGEIVKQSVMAAVMVVKESGEFTLKGLEQANDMINIASSGLGSALSGKDAANTAKAMQMGVALLATKLVAWVNAGRPELAADEKKPLDLNKIQDAVKAEGMSADDLGYVQAFVTAYQAKNGDAVSIRQLGEFKSEIDALQADIQAKNEARVAAGLAENKGLSDDSHAMTRQWLGASRLTDFLTFSADQGEIGKFAASVKSGAAQSLSGAAE